MGKRLRPITYILPKPLIPVRNKPILFWIVDWLIKNNIKEIMVTSYYKRFLLEKFVELYSRKIPEVNIVTIKEDKLYGRAYALKKLEPYLDKEFIVIDGDTITNLNIKEMISFHKEKKSLLTIAAKNKPILKGGLIKTDKNEKVVEFRETKLDKIETHLSNCGIYLFNKKVLKFVGNKTDDISTHLIPTTIKETNKVYAFRLPEDTFWYEYGTLKKYIRFIININKINL